jgi:hypothetical protein
MQCNKYFADPTVSVIFVHGLNGASIKTWTDGDVLWLRDLLPDILGRDRVRVLTFGYNANLSSGSAAGHITDFAQNLAGLISMDRRKSVIFIYCCIFLTL